MSKLHPAHWPIEPRRLLEDPAPDRIEQCAAWNLARALNIGRVVAFVGAGVPMAYGRISWKGLVETLASQIERDSLAAGRGEDLEDLRRRIKAMRSADAGPDQYPTLFQLTELLDHKLAEAKLRPAGSLRRSLAVHVFDDRGQGKELFRRAFAMTTNAKEWHEDFLQYWFGDDDSFDTQRRALDIHGENPQTRADAGKSAAHYRYRRLFTSDMPPRLAELAERPGSQVPRVLTPLVTALAKADSTRRGPIIPLHRFAVVALMRLLDGDVCARPEPPRAAVGEAAPSRPDSIDAARDPLLILYERLNIDRFLTTNYDLDIERLFRDVGYTEPPETVLQTGRAIYPAGPRTDRLDRLGGRSRDLVLTPKGHGRLLDFATQDHPSGPQLVHLHGRATHADGDSVVVTERDYQTLYQREDADRHPMDVARRVTFGGNPLLFVGLGMGEDDILRPLRHFMGQESQLGDRLAVAIMPGTKSRGQRLLEQMTLLNRYGVYSLYYGAATVLSGKAITDWLALIMAIADAVIAAADRGANPAANATAHIRDTLQAARDAGAVIGDHIDLPTALDGIVIADMGFTLSCEIGVLQACLNLMLDWTTILPGLSGEQEESALAAIRISVEGVKTALQSSCLCARLIGMERDWQGWKQDWFALPSPRKVFINPIEQLEVPPDPVAPHQPCRWFLPEASLDARHLVILPNLPDPDRPPEANRFFKNPPSRALHALQDALRGSSSELWRFYQGRRIYLLLARRGVGKGHVFTSLGESRGLAGFLAASWGQTLFEPEPLATYAGAAFYHLSFSHEIASVFDRITLFLEHWWDKVFPPPADPDQQAAWRRLAKALQDGAASLAGNRRGRLTHVFDLYQQSIRQFPATPHRLAIAISNPSTLYDDDGQAKNVGLARMFNLLFDDAYGTCPIDFILLCSTQGVPPQFRAPVCEPMLRILPDPSTPAHRRAVLDQEQELGLRPMREASAWLLPEQPGRHPITVCHLLRRTRAETLASTFFPRVAVAMAADAIGAEYRDLSRQELIAGQMSQRRSGERGTYWQRNDVTSQRLVRALMMIRADQSVPWEAWLEPVGRARLLEPKLQELATSVAGKFRDFGLLANRSRFGISLLLAAADEMIGPQETGLRQVDGGKAVSFIDHAADRLMGCPAAEKDALIVEIALMAMEQRHRGRACPPFKLRRVHRLGPVLHRLLCLLLWHIAVIGEPVDAEMLQACPEIADTLNELVRIGDEVCHAGSSEELRDALIQDALDLLVHRCLIFTAARRGVRAPAVGPLRYGMHRLIQRIVFRLLDAPLGQYPALDRFSLSLYLSQPADLPRPSFEAHQRLRRLLEKLAGYPEDDVADEAPVVEHLEKRAWRLRGAFGVLCSVYHVAIIGRFDSYGSQDSRAFPGPGHFELHRLLVQWLMRQAVRLDQASSRLSEPDAVMRPFYAEEIVWLLNECGVLSLAQGRLDDAHALFAQALHATRLWLAPNGGALATRIGLNAALADIERGAAQQAREAMEAIRQQRDEHPAIIAIAEGLIGLADHLAGELDAAERQYRLALSALSGRSNTRSASIFTRHLGDLIRARGPNHFRQAEEQLVAAEILAQQGSHEDAAQLARLAHARLLVAAGDGSRLVQAQQELDGIEGYAMAVGLPRLLTEVASVRAEAVLRQGETHRSTELAAIALELATLHDMRLFKTRALAALATALHRQGARDAAALVRRRAEELARRSKYTSMARRLDAPDDWAAPAPVPAAAADHAGSL